MNELPPSDAPVQQWIDEGLAVLTAKAQQADLKELTFTAAQAKAFVHLTAKGALAFDREARRHPGSL